MQRVLAGGSEGVANSAVTGRVLDDANQPFAGLVVGVYDVGLLDVESLLINRSPIPVTSIFSGYGVTDLSGNYAISYEPNNHDLIVRVFDTTKHQVARTNPILRVTTPTYAVPAITVPRAAVGGWTVTQGDTRIYTGCTVQWMVD